MWPRRKQNRETHYIWRNWSQNRRYRRANLWIANKIVDLSFPFKMSNERTMGGAWDAYWLRTASNHTSEKHIGLYRLDWFGTVITQRY